MRPSRYSACSRRVCIASLVTTAPARSATASGGGWQQVADLLEIARQAQRIMRRHPWLPTLVITRPTLGPNGIDLLEHLLDVLADHPAEPARKLEAFALLNALTALSVQNESAATNPGAQRESAYLHHVATAGNHPRIAALLAVTSPDEAPHDQFAAVLTRALTGVPG
ncbi:TetR/AcrR family transcriptional regulator C-terminal domain-containing protein [Streptomyces inhibens]|uniref:TetR/AcrR family transcriptional regulator C-terminal domain-containing protein n=1 Tax=Streptomyces inhibens TaxID=2293571 RepID=UPI001EE77271|nr:TetR/AcrR family transcriptional regulator C-terminal domain-containing protein [Streptomyces inhibens]UKY47523.1 TetR/AcrR family transcriptional regulator C-terminal domain-containing protein [Streptomyces inhibens]